MEYNNKYKLVPENGNLILEKYEYDKEALEDEEEVEFFLPKEQQKKLDLDKDGIYRLTMDCGEKYREGDLVVVPNRTIGEVKMINGDMMKYAHRDRVIMRLEKIDE